MSQPLAKLRFACPWLCWIVVAGMLIPGVNHAFAQSVGFNITTNSTWVGLYDNGEGVSLAPASVAGLVPQAYWNNIGYQGSVNAGVVTNSAGNPVSLNLQWCSSYAYSAYGANSPYGTPDGLLMSGFIGTYSPSAPTNALGGSVSDSPADDLPLIYVSGLTAWYTNIVGAVGYQVVVYTTGWSSYETSGYWIQSVTGSPFNNTMSGGAALTSTNWLEDSGAYDGTYIPITSTSSSSPTLGANYMESGTLTNDAVLIRSCCITSYGGVGINGFQLVPVFPPKTNANVTINATDVINTVPTNAFGIFMAVWDTWGGDTPNQLKQAGVTAMRYPGGSYADSYDWSTYQMIPAFGQAGNIGYLSGYTDMGHFIQLMSNAQEQAVISVDWGSGFLWNANKTALAIPNTNGSPQEAAAWVAYCNANTNIYGTPNDVTIGVDAEGNNWQTAGYWAMMRAASPLAQNDGYNFLRINHPAPVGIKYWEVGNEPYGNGYYGGGNDWECDYAVPYPYTNYTRYANALLSPGAYGQAVKAFSTAMKAVDPTIKVGAYSSTPPADYSWDYLSGVNNGQHWTPLVLAQCGSNIDFVIVHWYPTFSDNVGTSLLSEVGSTIPVMFSGTGPYPHTGVNSGLEDWITNYCPNPGNVQIAITEFGADNSPYLVTSTNGMPILGPVEALFAADCISTWLDYPAYANADWLDWDGDSFMGSGSNGPVVCAYQMLRHWAAPGDAIVKAASDTSTLRAQAAMQPNGRLDILLINESISSTERVNLTITNANLGTTGTLYQFGTNNWSEADYNNEVPSSGPATNIISGISNSFSISLPAYTMDVLVIPIVSNSPPVLAAITNRTLNVGQTVTFTAIATDTNQPPPTLTFTLLNAPTNAILNATTGAFSWQPLVSQANTTNPITLQVTASGTPSLSANQSFTVTVNPLTVPSVSPVAWNDGRFILRVSGESGPDYELQTSTNLMQWSAAYTTNSPAMPFSWQDTAATNSARFYRVVVGPPLP